MNIFSTIIIATNKITTTAFPSSSFFLCCKKTFTFNHKLFFFNEKLVLFYFVLNLMLVESSMLHSDQNLFSKLLLC